MAGLCLGALAGTALAAPSAALQFDGVDDRVIFGAATNLSSFTFTLETWFKRTGAGVGASSGGGGVPDAIPLIAKGRGEADGDNRDLNYILAIRAADSRLVADFEEGGAGPSPGLNHPVAGLTVLTNNGWYHAAVSYDGAEWRLYLNGALETTLSVGRPARGDSIQHAALGAALDSTGAAAGAFAGVLDEARIWNYARSTQEIADNFRREIISANGLIGRWGLNEGSGLTATNSGSAAVNGTLANGPVWVAGYAFTSPPTIAITNPPSGTIVVAPTNVLIEARAADADGTVTKVSFFADAALLGSGTNAPFAFTWTNPPVGAHTLLAVALDDSGLSTTSAPVVLAVEDPIVRLTAPTNGARFLAPASVSLIATVTETNVPVTQVEFFAGGSSIGLLNGGPWNFTWNISQLGPQTLRAVATDASGTHTSAPVALEIISHAAPVVSIIAPPNYSVVPSGTNLTVTATASDSDGTVTNVEFFLNGFRVANDTTAPYNYIWSNAPLGNFTLTARATDNEGLTNWSGAVNVSVVLSANGTNTLIAQRSAWRYLDTGVDPGASWNTPGFNDALWATGLAQLGYGDGDEATVIGFGPDVNNRYITTWFRHAWWVDDPGAFSSLQLRLLRDDGAVVYLNGTEVARQNMPAGTITTATLAPAAVGGTDETTFFNTSVSAGALVAGTNVIAVEIHQATANSSDVSFDLQLIALSGSAGAPGVVRGPYLLSATTNSVVVRWRTDVATNSVVRFGSSAMALAQVVTSTAFTNEHAVTVSNLDVASRYFYAIGAGTNILAGATTNHFFNTLPTPGVAKPTRLWVLGDSGTANANAQSVRNAYLNYAATNGAADFWLMLGDNAYNSGTDPEYQGGVFDMYPTVLRNCVLWPTIGNHDTAQQTSVTTFPYLDIFTLPQAGQSGGIASGTKRYYAFDYANVHFICLDSMTSGRTTNSAMFNWLRADLEATSQEWIIAYWHHPPYTKGSHNSDAESDLVQIRQNFLPLLESHGVDLVLAGHSHCYERSFLLNGHYGLSSSLTAGMKVDPGDGRTNGTGAYFKSTGTGAAYVVAGNGGQATGGPLNHPAMFVSLNELGSLVIDVNSNRIDLRMLGPSDVRDTFTLIKQIAPAPQFVHLAGQSFKARRERFLQNGYLALTNAGPGSSAGGAVSLLNDWVRYVPPGTPTNVDSFPFIVTNNLSRAAIGTATVSIATNLAPSVNFTSADESGGMVRLRFSGIPGRSYSIQFSDSLDVPVWQTLATATADVSGAFELVDTPPAGPPRFYRSIQP